MDETKTQPEIARQVRHQDLMAQGTQGTVWYEDGGVGLAYRMPSGGVYRTTGSYWAVLVDDGFEKMREFKPDKGAGYMAAVRSLLGGRMKGI